MVRRTDIRRDSKPSSRILFHDADEKARLEARNGLLQFDEVMRLVDEAVKPGASFKLRPSTIQGLHRIAIQDIYTCAGSYRTHGVQIMGTTHEPPRWEEVSQLVEDACDYVVDNWQKSAIHLAAYLMWRINWIHPFSGGNGRTSRVVSYLVLCVKIGWRLPGTLTIPEQIVANRKPYYKALDAADAAYAKGQVDERHYLGVVRGIPREARTLESAMQIEALAQRIIELASASESSIKRRYNGT